MTDICELIEPIKVSRKPDQIAEQLKAMIANGVLEPGSGFPTERELSLAFCGQPGFHQGGHQNP